MARTDSFFIRQSVTIPASLTFTQESIDLGAYVDALGKAVLRIKNLAVTFSDSNGGTPDMATTKNAACDFQVTTQTQSDMVIPGDNRSVVASGRIVANSSQGAGVPSAVSHDLDVTPQHWDNGYLIGVDTLYLGGKATSTGWSESIVCSIVMECVSESLTQAAAMALALSQS
jgi:hypothetical protein